MFTNPYIPQTKQGTSPGKSTDIVVVDLKKVSSWPTRDSRKIKMLGNIVMNQGAYVYEIYGTSSSISAPVTSEGEEDAITVSGLPEFAHPGAPLELEEFFAHHLNKPLAVGIKVSDSEGEYYRFYGSPTAPLTLMPERQDDNEALKDTIKFQQFKKTSELPGRYYGTLTRATAFAVAADAVTVDASEGSGEYQLADNTAPLVITNIVNATINEVYTLKGSGGTHPATIEATNANFVTNGADWQGLAGSTITFLAYEQTATPGTFKFIEQTRS